MTNAGLLLGDEGPNFGGPNVLTPPARQEDGKEWEKRSYSSSRTSFAPRNRQPSLSAPLGRQHSVLSSAISPRDESKPGILDFSPWSLRRLSRSLLSPWCAPASMSSNDKRGRKIQLGFQKNAIFFMLSLLGIFFLFDWWVLSGLRGAARYADQGLELPIHLQGEWSRFRKGERFTGILYRRLLGLAAHALAEDESSAEPADLWKELFTDASAWRPCADEKNLSYGLTVASHNTGYILISANGGLNQQRVAICNGVAVAHMLNATLVIPQFQFSSVWQDTSQFGDIYQENYFIDHLKNDVRIVKELPVELQSLDLEAIGSFVTDMDVPKEAKPSFYTIYILPILLRNRVVHLFGFGNRLSFDPVPFDIQRLRCRCNFHALKFTPKIQRAGALLVGRMRERTKKWGPEMSEGDDHGSLAVSQQARVMHMLVDAENAGNLVNQKNGVKYLGLHLRFEMDMVAYSMCEFGGGKAEQQELETYREIHFPTLATYKQNGKLHTAAQLREDGKCPLTPEEAVLMLVALGFKRATRIFLAGAHIYGGQSRMATLMALYPNLVTKEDLLSSEELEPFVNKSSQLAALDFIGCAAADVFAMTDSGSQLASLVSGHRIYYGGGLLPTIRPNKRRLASIFSENMTIEWEDFRERVRKAVRESKRVQKRPIARSVYRHPRCLECMCNTVGAIEEDDKPEKDRGMEN